ncbi:hypothetical protein BJY01DRAFT_245554 [Aspergillus pseudoustus]|uniref:Uncharacterized protein n=1 Tax=Aspergillus pseudoustus TaxID=1810923 RepID=A0ABR4KGA2_9EURO
MRLLAGALFAALTTMAVAYPTERPNALGLDPVNLSWKASPSPGESPITLNGTAEQVHAQPLKINPNYDGDWKDVDDDDDDISSAPVHHPTVLEPRLLEEDMTCDNEDDSTDGKALSRYIDDGIEYLRKRAKDEPPPRLPPMRCARVSCAYKAGIFWCNDDSFQERTLPSWNNIADGAQTILDHCSKKGWIAGELRHSDKWRTLIMQSKKGC